ELLSRRNLQSMLVAVDGSNQRHLRKQQTAGQGGTRFFGKMVGVFLEIVVLQRRFSRGENLVRALRIRPRVRRGIRTPTASHQETDPNAAGTGDPRSMIFHGLTPAPTVPRRLQRLG